MKRIAIIVGAILAIVGIAYAATKSKNTNTDNTLKKAASNTNTPLTTEQIRTAQAEKLAKENEEREQIGLPPKTDPGPSHS